MSSPLFIETFINSQYYDKNMEIYNINLYNKYQQLYASYYINIKFPDNMTIIIDSQTSNLNLMI